MYLPQTGRSKDICQTSCDVADTELTVTADYTDGFPVMGGSNNSKYVLTDQGTKIFLCPSFIHEKNPHQSEPLHYLAASASSTFH